MKIIKTIGLALIALILIAGVVFILLAERNAAASIADLNNEASYTLKFCSTYGTGLGLPDKGEYCIFGEAISNEYYLATFHRTADSLIIETIYHSPIDTLVRFDELSIVGIDSTGRFRIEQLTNEKMILLNTVYQLTFRKY